MIVIIAMIHWIRDFVLHGEKIQEQMGKKQRVSRSSCCRWQKWQLIVAWYLHFSHNRPMATPGCLRHMTRSGWCLAMLLNYYYLVLDKNKETLRKWNLKRPRQTSWNCNNAFYLFWRQRRGRWREALCWSNSCLWKIAQHDQKFLLQGFRILENVTPNALPAVQAHARSARPRLPVTYPYPSMSTLKWFCGCSMSEYLKYLLMVARSIHGCFSLSPA